MDLISKKINLILNGIRLEEILLRNMSGQGHTVYTVLEKVRTLSSVFHPIPHLYIVRILL
jgi:hypothetical protein